MSIIQQADAVNRERGIPHQVVELTGATAKLDEVHWGDGSEHRVHVSGRDAYGRDRVVAIPFQQHFRGEAAVLVDEIERTGGVVLKGRVQLGTKEFQARSAESGTARLGSEHDRFDLKRVITHGLGMLRGRKNEDIEDIAVAAHRAKSSVGR